MDNLEDKIRKIIDKSLAGDLYKSSNEISKEENLFNIGLDSLNIVKLIIGIENEYDIVFEDDEIASTNWRTISAIENLLKNKI